MNDTSRTNIVLFDDECSLCTFQSRVITWLDWFNTVSLMPISSKRVAEVAPRLTRTDLQEAIHCVPPNGCVQRGARCIRHISLRMPLAFPVAVVLWIPGVIHVAEIVYRWISRHRHLLSRVFGCKDACAIMPARRRANEERLELDVR
jgi:predicted DCC family thiol-disulfide oxidoreductase YuxK